MPDLNEDSLKQLGRLCRLEIAEEEMPALLHDLKQVLAYIEQLQDIDVNQVIPYSHFDQQSIDTLREDTLGPLLSRTDFLSNAPDQVGGMVRVPPILNSP